MVIVRSILVFSLIFLSGLLASYLFTNYSHTNSLNNPLSQSPSPTPTVKPLLKYTFDNLNQYIAQPSQIKIEEIINESELFTSHIFSFTSQEKRITGQLNTPNISTPSAGFPTILMIRGFIDPEAYQTGMGTKSAAAQFATHVVDCRRYPIDTRLIQAP